VPFALLWIGYVVGISVFCDSGFFLLFPMGKSLALRQNIWSRQLCLIALATGLGTSHTLVPPTPGPLAVALLLNADLSLVISLGCLIGMVIVILGTPYGVLIEFKVLRKMVDETPVEPKVITECTDIPGSDDPFHVEHKPHLLSCVFIIVLPVFLITFGSIAALTSNPFGTSVYVDILRILGNPAVALFVGALASLFLLPKWDLSELSETGVLGKSLKDCATIILIIGASGSFGSVLQATGMATMISTHLSLSGFGIFIPIVLCGCIRSAIGSATVAMITTATIVKDLMPFLGLTSEMDKVFTVIGIGVGSFFVTHINDSFFWILSQYINLPLKVMFITQTIGSFLSGLTGALVVALFQYSIVAGSILSGCCIFLYGVFLFFSAISRLLDQENDGWG